MSLSSLGDLAQSFMLQRRSAAIRQDMSRLTHELATGQKADMRQVLAGNHGYISQIERTLSALTGFTLATQEAEQFMDGIQYVLDGAQEKAGKLGADLISASNSVVGLVASNPSQNAETELRSVMGLLNTQSAGRSLFAGVATDAPPLATTDALLADLRTAMTGAGSVSAMLAAADTWFDTGGGFETLIYQGSATALAPFQLSDQETVQLDVRADDPAIREVLKHFAVAALAEDPALGLTPAEKAEMFSTTGAGLLVGQSALTALRTGIGFSQARVDEIATRNAATQTGLEMSRNALLSVDPFETATKLEDVQFQLQSLYAVTVKSSQLSLVNFL